MAAYCASKAYVLSLGEALARELRGTRSHTHHAVPGRDALRFRVRIRRRLAAAVHEQARSENELRGRRASGLRCDDAGEAGARYRGHEQARRHSGRVFPRAVVFPIARLLLGDHG